MICSWRVSRQWTFISRHHRMISADTTTFVFFGWTKVELSVRPISLFAFRRFVRESVHRGFVRRFPLPANQLYCTVVLYRRPPVVLLVVRPPLAHNVRSQLYFCTAVLRVLLANKEDWTNDAAIVLFTVPSLVWSSYTSMTSAQNNRNIRLDVFPK